MARAIKMGGGRNRNFFGHASTTLKICYYIPHLFSYRFKENPECHLGKSEWGEGGRWPHTPVATPLQCGFDGQEGDIPEIDCRYLASNDVDMGPVWTSY